MTDSLVAPTAPAQSDLPPARAPYVIPDGLAQRLARRVVAPARPEQQVSVTPLTGGVLASLPVSTVDSVDHAYRTASAAQHRWALVAVRDRARVLLRLHDSVLQHRDELMDLIQLESGKTRRQAFEEVMDVAGVCRHYARRGEDYLKPRKRPGALPVLTQTVELRHPKGVVGIVAPWNYPLSMSITDLIPAVLAGNAVVLRPDEKSALTALRSIELLDQAGLPEGVVQIVLGDGSTIGQAVLDRADYVMFTGSTKTGRGIARDAGERLVGASLELGGKNAMYVAADANLKAAADGAVRSVFSSAGQLCISIERLIVHEAVADEFLAHFLPRVRAMKIGPELDWGNDMGSLISSEQLDKVTSHVDDARAKGATVLAGGRPRPEIGPYFYEPTVLEGVTAAMSCRDEETFGPLVSIYRVATDDEAVELANDTSYGLNASVFTRDTARGRALAARIKAGTVNVNEGYIAAWASYGSPMGGMRQSGLGRRHGAEGINKYTETQTVAVQHVMPIAPTKGVSEKVWAMSMTVGLKIMKAGRIS